MPCLLPSIIYITNYIFNMDQLFSMEELSKLFTNYAPKVAGALLTLVIGFIIANWITRLFKRVLGSNKVDPTVIPFLASMVSVGLKVLVLLSAARMFGIETTSFIAIFSALAFAIGLALQGSLGHFASGVLLLVFRPYKVGDLVTLGGGQTGTVDSIQVFNTVLQTLDNKRIIIPNGMVTSNIITNISGQGEIGVDLNYSISSSADIDKARQVILGVAKKCPHVDQTKEVLVKVSKLDIGITQFLVRPWANSDHYWDVFFFMNEEVKKAFDAEGVKAPVPGMNVNVIKD